ncbi:hypothetical protein PAPYR_7607 [Paratrimastix pyriformis]|uniref:Uncharacterized protein n=1 Tax=Paratrimastix pyriformis TaxID=342808 RepID=A0ABQ8UJK7_9EUKA|nr:hypothetical protein PAPYR_7607 [Paratrimastix pyriformis]
MRIATRVAVVCGWPRPDASGAFVGALAARGAVVCGGSEWPARVPAVLGALAADAARAACAACAACTAWPLSAFAGLAGLWAFVSAACVVFRAVRFPDGPVDAFCCSACLAGRTRVALVALPAPGLSLHRAASPGGRSLVLPVQFHSGRRNGTLRLG